MSRSPSPMFDSFRSVVPRRLRLAVASTGLLACLCGGVLACSGTSTPASEGASSSDAGMSGSEDGSASTEGPVPLDRPITDELKTGIEEGSGSFDHAAYDALLSAHVDQSEGTVDYEALKDKEGELDSYLERIAEADLETLSRDAQLALLINAYNAYTLSLILENYPGIESIEDLEQPWSKERYEVGGHTLSLDQIEHGLIRPLYRDPRIHFAVNCAAVDCPYLAASAYEGSEIDRQLESRTEAILSNEQFVKVEGETLRYPKVMKWYETDFVGDGFEGSADGIAQYIAPYTRDGVRSFIQDNGGEPETKALNYDWSLNDAN